MKFGNQEQSVYEIYREKFSTDSKAKRYSTRHVSSRKGKREKQCIANALAQVKKNSLILDLPCGTGRLSHFIKTLGFRVIAADCSLHMLHYAKQNYAALNDNTGFPIQFEQQEVANIQYPDNHFQATVCNRLFHHYPDAAVRRLALKELARVTKGPIIISFFNSHSLSAWLTRFKNKFLRKNPKDRLAIPFNEFKRDIQASGLKIESIYYTSFGLSPQTYVKLIQS